MKTILFLFLFFFGFVCFAQNQIYHIDSLGRKQGFFTYPNVINLIKNEKIIRGIEVWESGYYIDSQREGIWNDCDDKGLLVGQRYYNHDTIIFEIHYIKGRITSIIRYTTKQHYTEDKNIADFIYEYADIISFDKRGHAKKRTYKDINGAIITEKYK